MSNEAFNDALVRHVLFLQRSARGLYDQLEATLFERDRAILRRATRYAEQGRPLTQRQQRSVRRFIDSVDREWAQEYTELYVSHMAELSRVETGFTNRALAVHLGAEDTKTVRTSRRLVREALQKTYADPRQNQTVWETMRRTLGTTHTRTLNVLNRGFQEGQPIREIGAALRQVSAATRRETEMVARTGTNAIANEVRDRTYRANDDIIQHLVWVSVLDERTSDYCQSMDGVQLPLDSGPRPPAHPNCRSTTVPVLKGETQEEALGPRASVGSNTERNKRSLERARVRGDRAAGPTKSYVDYEGFLKRQSAAFQDEVLGKTRGKAFREGRLTYAEMVKRTKEGYFQRPLTLEELGLRSQQAA